MKALKASILALWILTGCTEVSTTDPVEAYHYWAGTNPPEDIEVIQAQYWQSAHWTKEYILYLKIKPSKAWWKAFIVQNNLEQDHEQWSPPQDAPEWFKLPDSFTLYKPGDDFRNSRFFCDSQSGACYIYDMQL